MMTRMHLMLGFAGLLSLTATGYATVGSVRDTGELYDTDTESDDPVEQPCLGDQRTQLARNSRIGIGRVQKPNSVCTGFILSNGAFVTAGHCVDNDADGVVDSTFLSGTVDFNVPDSSLDGCIALDSSVRSYPIDSVVAFEHETGLGGSKSGKDWAVFRVNLNGLGKDAALEEGFLRPDNDGAGIGTTIRVTGYGDDTHPNNGGQCGGNSRAYTLQTNTGPVEFVLAKKILHKADTEGGNSGSPIIKESTGRAVGIHNAGLCNLELFNSGVSFKKDLIQDAINGFHGSNAVHLDAAAPSDGDGSAFDPYDGLSEAVDATPAGGKLVIVTGTYSGAVTIEKEMDIINPVGAVDLGD